MQHNSVSAKLKSTWQKNNNILATKKKNLSETWATQDVHHSVTIHLERGSNPNDALVGKGRRPSINSLQAPRHFLELLLSGALPLFMPVITYQYSQDWLSRRHTSSVEGKPRKWRPRYRRLI